MRYFRSSWSVGAARGLTSTPGLGQSWGHNHAVSLVIGGATSNFARVLWGDGSISGFAWDSSSASWKAVNGADTLAPVTAGAGGLVLARAQDDSKWLFDPSGRLSTVTSRNGWVTSYFYSDAATSISIAPRAGLLIRVTNQFGRSLGFIYGPAGELSSMIAPDGQSISYVFDSAKRLTGVVFPGGTAKSYLYEDAAWPKSMTGIIDETGTRLATVAYDSQGRAISSGYAGGAGRYSVAKTENINP